MFMNKIIPAAEKAFFLFSFALFAAASSAAETFRVRKVFPVTISGDASDEQTIVTGINDSIAFFLPDDMTFLEGIEVKTDIPEAVAQWRDCVACSIYTGITPKPDTSQIDYTGTRAFVSTLPSRLTWIVQIPLKKQTSLKDSAYASLLDYIPFDAKNRFVFMRFQPAMKGVPDETYNSELRITVKPLLSDKGRLRMSIRRPDKTDRQYTVFIDENEVKPQSGGYLLSSGVHDISIVSEDYRNETRTVRVDQGKTTDLEILLKSIEPTLLVTAPDTAVVYLDNEKCEITGKPFVVTEGEHKVKFLMGDYELIRSITVQKGKSYTAALTVDLKISEE